MLRTIDKHVPEPKQATLDEDEKQQIVDLHQAFKQMSAGKAFR